MIFKKAVIIAGISGIVLTVSGQAWSGQKVIIGSPDAALKITEAEDKAKVLIKNGKNKVKTDEHGTKIKAGQTTVDSDGNINAGGVKIPPEGGIKID